MSYGKIGRRIIGFLILAIVLVAIWIPSSQLQAKSGPSDNQTNTYKCGSDKKPCVIKIKPTDDQKEKSAQEQSDRASKTIYDERTLKFTKKQTIFAGDQVLIALLQLGVFGLQLLAFIAQAWFMCRTVKEMKIGTAATIKVANAAKKSADAAILHSQAAVGTELPILRAIPDDLVTLNGPLLPNQQVMGGITHGPPSRYSGIANTVITNYGRTPAFPIIFKAGWKAIDHLPDIPVYTHTVKFNHATVINPPPNDGVRIDVDCGIELTQDEIAEIIKGESWLWFYGTVIYSDFMNITREARFCWRLANRNLSGQRAFYFFASDGEPPPAYIRAPDQKG